jgi:hypothetical protein
LAKAPSIFVIALLLLPAKGCGKTAKRGKNKFRNFSRPGALVTGPA